MNFLVSTSRVCFNHRTSLARPQFITVVNHRTPFLAFASSSAKMTTTSTEAPTTLYDFKPLDGKGNPHPLSTHRSQVVLIVNVASKCGFTPQYTALESLYQKYKSRPFTILGFPCNQFGGQEPGTNDEIQEFCKMNYGVTFPILGKVEVNGDKEDPLWSWLKKEKPGLMGLKRVKWNFEKFLVDGEGKVVERWASTTKPASLEERIEEELKKVEGKGEEGDKSKAELKA